LAAIVQVFFLLLNYVIAEALPLLLIWPAVDPSWSRLALALSDIGEASVSFSQKPPL